jgi:hypothetical protein
MNPMQNHQRISFIRTTFAESINKIGLTQTEGLLFGNTCCACSVEKRKEVLAIRIKSGSRDVVCLLLDECRHVAGCEFNRLAYQADSKGKT